MEQICQVALNESRSFAPAGATRAGVSPLRGRLTFASSGKSKQKRRQERGQFECPLSCTSPLRPKRACGPPLDSPLERALVRSDVAQRIGSPIRASRRTMPRSGECVGDVRMDKPLPNGGSNGGPVGPPWSFRKRGESRGEENPLERVFLPSGALLPSFPAKEKKVGPAGPKLLLDKPAPSCIIRI